MGHINFAILLSVGRVVAATKTPRVLQMFPPVKNCPHEIYACGSGRHAPPVSHVSSPWKTLRSAKYYRHGSGAAGPWQVVTLTAGSKRRSLLMAGDDDEMFMTRSLNVTPKTTEQHLIVRSNKSVAYVNSQFNEKRPHRTHRAKWPLTYAHNKTKKT